MPELTLKLDANERVIGIGQDAAEASRQRWLAKDEADRSEAEADRAETNAAFAEEFGGRAYASQAAGEAATTEGQFFRVPIGTTPETYTRYQRTAGGSVEAAPLATTADLASPEPGKGGSVVYGTSLVDGDLPSFNTSLAGARVSGNAKRLILKPAQYSPATAMTITGEFADGLLLDGANSVITPASGENGQFVGNVIGSIASEYYNKFRFSNFALVGSGRTNGASGLLVEAGADMAFTNYRVRNFERGLYLNGGLSNSFVNITLRDNGIGLKADYYDDGPGGLSVFGPNANSFFGLKLFQNDLGIDYTYSPSTAINFFGGNSEANNYTAGTRSDGKKVHRFVQAGHINQFGIHSESNRGQYTYWYEGFTNDKVMLTAGSEIIDEGGTLVHIQKGTFCGIASRIFNSGAPNNVFLNTGTYATLIDCETPTPNGDKSHIAAIRYGRMMLGGNPVPGSAPFTIQSDPIAGNSNIAADFRNDTVQLRFLSTAGARTGYIQYGLADHVLANDNVGGFVFNCNGAARLRVGALGAANIEPGADNTIDCGSAVRRWKNLYAAQIRPGPPNGPIWTSGSGSPEGVVPASVGSLYTRTDGGAGSTLYVKESGTGSTGWVAK